MKAVKSLKASNYFRISLDFRLSSKMIEALPFTKWSLHLPITKVLISTASTAGKPAKVALLFTPI